MAKFEMRGPWAQFQMGRGAVRILAKPEVGRKAQSLIAIAIIIFCGGIVIPHRAKCNVSDDVHHSPISKIFGFPHDVLARHPFFRLIP